MPLYVYIIFHFYIAELNFHLTIRSFRIVKFLTKIVTRQHVIHMYVKEQCIKDGVTVAKFRQWKSILIRLKGLGKSNTSAKLF